MTEKIGLIFIAFFSVFLFYSNCEKNNEEISDRFWSKIIKEMTIILAAHQADSIKIAQIKFIFEKYEISKDDYRRFYEEFVEHNPLESAVLLQELVTFITADLDTLAQERQRKMKNYNSNITDARKK